jgi:ABC-2 type transport system ATP-binding protein
MIRTKELTFNYSKEHRLFAGLDLELECGNIIGLFGKNGAGKSTFLKLITGLLKPNKGNIKVDGLTPFSRFPDFLENVFLITEELYIPQITIKKYIKAYAPFYKKFDLEKMNRILKEFELKDTVVLSKISHGQKKKFMIAFALSTNCKYLLLDEPTNGLDIPSKSVFRKVLVSSIEDDQLVIISTHQVKGIETIIDKVIILENGEIIFNNDIDTISRNIQFKKVQNISNHSDVLYSEKDIEGYKVIIPVTNNEETGIDVELLFNGIINNAKITF